MTSFISPDLLRAVLRQDFLSFLHKVFITLHPQQNFLNNWHLRFISEHLQAVEKGEIPRLLINIPPRHLKSICVNVAWPAWLLGKDPTTRIISASYSNSLSYRHFFSLRGILSSPWYKQCFPKVKIIKDTKDRIQTAHNGFCFATSVGGTLTGEGGDYIIIDDPHKPNESSLQRHKTIQWFQETLSSRLNNVNGAIVTVMQRIHADDLSGFLLSQGKWHYICLPAFADIREHLCLGNFQYTRAKGEVLQPNRLSRQDLENIEARIGSYAFAAQYQQKPLASRASIIKQEWLAYYKLNLPVSNSTIYQSWDCAIKQEGDYTVCTTWLVREGKFYLLDVLREKLEYPKLRASIEQMAKKFCPKAILIEDKASGQQLLQELKELKAIKIEGQGEQIYKPRLIAIQPKYDKVTRLTLTSPIFAAGLVLLPYQEPTWLSDFISEILAFPFGKYDDQVDSVAQFLLWVEQELKVTQASIPMIRLI